MVEAVDPGVALEKVGVPRHPDIHWAKAVTAEETVYILHSGKCLVDYRDLKDCPMSKALEKGIDEDEWPPDTATPVQVVGGKLTPSKR